MKDQIKEAAYKKQISELQSKLMTERRSNAKIAKRAEKEEEWIPVSERLPESGRYLCVVEEQNDLGKSRFVWNCSYSELHGFMDNLQPVVVTHWMPLPNIPKSK